MWRKESGDVWTLVIFGVHLQVYKTRDNTWYASSVSLSLDEHPLAATTLEAAQREAEQRMGHTLFTISKAWKNYIVYRK